MTEKGKKFWRGFFRVISFGVAFSKDKEKMAKAKKVVKTVRKVAKTIKKNRKK